jgi:hypothetical protein
MFRFLLFLALVGTIALSALWGGWPVKSDSLILPTLEPLKVATPTPVAQDAVNPSFAVAPAAPPDVSQAYGVARLGNKQVSFGYLNQAQVVFDCQNLDASPVFAGLATHQQIKIRTMCQP